jgi:hypothetical protein
MWTRQGKHHEFNKRVRSGPVRVHAYRRNREPGKDNCEFTSDFRFREPNWKIADEQDFLPLRRWAALNASWRRLITGRWGDMLEAVRVYGAGHSLAWD